MIITWYYQEFAIGIMIKIFIFIFNRVKCNNLEEK